MTRKLLRVALAAVLGSGSVASPEASPVIPRPDRVDRTIDRGVDFLLSLQDERGAIYVRSHDTTMTSLAILAMAAAGHQPADSSEEGRAMAKAIEFVLEPGRQDSQGYYGGRDGSRMYGHGITTLMLAEMLGMGVDREQDDEIEERCRKAVELILRSQKTKRKPHVGGWRYLPDSTDADISITVWQILALRAAKNAGLDVPRRAIDSAIRFLKRAYKPVREKGKKKKESKIGVFPYMVGVSPAATTSTVAAGMLALQLCGSYEAPQVDGAANYLLSHPPNPGRPWFYYGTYYYAQAMYQQGGDHAAIAERLVADRLLPLQRKDGAWTVVEQAPSGTLEAYSTSLAILSLAVKKHYLPIYQR